MLAICNDHCDMLHRSLDLVGIDHLHASSFEQLSDFVNGKVSTSSLQVSSVSLEVLDELFDSFYLASFNIMKDFTILFGDDILVEQNVYCPLCVLKQQYELHLKPEGCGNSECKITIGETEAPWDVSAIAVAIALAQSQRLEMNFFRTLLKENL